ncbi:MAG: asparagine synthase (glutamine-hydrolyzing) [Acidobacteria bacterium]|nr:asparagine synthase (glutamine-hydrolyzing) [Acidobacteriota bacterium]
MCGIAGYASLAPDCPESVLEQMTDTIHHRGPDGVGYYRDSLAALGHRRLSIIDLAGGSQPMANEDRTLWIVYNGEIFNHASLRPELEAMGHRYQSRCDTETILHAYEQYGAACLSRFRGMFSFAIWDTAKRRLFCARDRLGIKPFYYYWDGRWFVFASEIKALLKHPAVPVALDSGVLSEHLAFGYTCGDKTLFAGIRKLMPGHYLDLSLSESRPELRIENYWDVPAGQPDSTSDEEWIAECRRRVEETVRMRLMSDVPLGMFLSGGVDSSAIAALMKRMTSTPVETFSVGYREEQSSELGYARQASRMIGASHHEIVVGMDDFFNVLPRLVWHEDEPLAWPSSVSLYFVSRLASERVKVVLTGEGSDELFGGYARYHFYLLNQRWMRLYRWVPEAAQRWMRDRIADSRLLSGDLRRKFQHTVLGRAGGIESLYLDNFYAAFPPAEQESVFPRLEPEAAYADIRCCWQRALPRSALGRMLYTDQKTYLVELLMKQDQMSMACSIESRVPFLDHPLVEFAAGVPDRLKIRRGSGKYILKKAFEDLLPAEILNRPKMGFPTPLRQWLRSEAAAPLFAMLVQKGGLLSEVADLGAVGDLLDRHQQNLEDATDRLWRLLNLQIWGEIFLRGNRDFRLEPLLAGAAQARL